MNHQSSGLGIKLLMTGMIVLVIFSVMFHSNSFQIGESIQEEIQNKITTEINELIQQPNSLAPTDIESIQWEE